MPGRMDHNVGCLAKVSKKISYCAVTGKQDQPRHMRKPSDGGKDTESALSINPVNVSRLSYHGPASIKFRNIEYEASRCKSRNKNSPKDPQVR